MRPSHLCAHITRFPSACFCSQATIYPWSDPSVFAVLLCRIPWREALTSQPAYSSISDSGWSNKPVVEIRNSVQISNVHRRGGTTVGKRSPDTTSLSPLVPTDCSSPTYCPKECTLCKVWTYTPIPEMPIPERPDVTMETADEIARIAYGENGCESSERCS